MDPQKMCSHTDPQHASRSEDECRAITALEQVIERAAFDEALRSVDSFFSDEPSEPLRYVADRDACRPAFDYIIRLEDLSRQRAQTLESVAEFARRSSHPDPDQAQGHLEARGQLVERMRLYLQRLAHHAPQDAPVFEARDPEIGLEECKAVVTHIKRQEEQLAISDQALDAVKDFIAERRALQEEQYAVSRSGTPQAEKARRVLQGKLDARKKLAALIRPNSPWDERA